MSDLQFEGRVVVVTGGGRGIGEAYALELARRGANVVVSDLGSDAVGSGTSAGPADSVVEAITAAGGSAVASTESVATEEGAAAIIETAMSTFGRVDAVINNAGIFDVHPFLDLPAATFRQFFEVHVLGSVFVSRAAWPHLVDSGVGRIVNTVSGGMLGVPMMSHYAAAKGAVYALTRALAVEGHEFGIRVNAVAPGAATRLSDAAEPALPPGSVEYIRANSPAALVAPVGVYLAHPSCELNGEVLNAGSGRASRQVMMGTAGIHHPELTAEMVRDRIDEVMDTSSAEVSGLMLPTE
jgi:NAD(P)-dependent dehydrogenase (short-subunit alcohol dehydrogenase family)